MPSAHTGRWGRQAWKSAKLRPCCPLSLAIARQLPRRGSQERSPRAVRPRALPLRPRPAVPRRGQPLRLRLRRPLPQQPDRHRPHALRHHQKHRRRRHAPLLPAHRRQRQRGGVRRPRPRPRPRQRQPRRGQPAPDRLQPPQRRVHGRAELQHPGAARDQRQHRDLHRQHQLRCHRRQRHRRPAGGQRQGQPRLDPQLLRCLRPDRRAVHRADPPVLRPAAQLPHRGARRRGGVHPLLQRRAMPAPAALRSRAAGVRREGERPEAQRLFAPEPERAGDGAVPHGHLRRGQGAGSAQLPADDGVRRARRADRAHHGVDGAAREAGRAAEV